jgi:uncharacterized protein
MYIERQLKSILLKNIKLFPAVLVTGPRQAGKSTLLFNEASSYSYVTFDDPLNRNFATEDPKGFLDQFKDKPVILDEIQYVPNLLSYLKISIDSKRHLNGRWILTGSQQFHLTHHVSESLAGRIAILELLPFSIQELPTTPSLEKIIWNGGYPEPFLYPKKRDMWIQSYLQTYIERDLRQLQNVHNLRTFELFISLIAGRHSQIFNGSDFARECGVSLPTIKSWVSALQTAYICYALPPYHKNYGKRITKSPKLYFIDPLLVCHLTRQPDSHAALAGPLAGSLFEGLIVSEALKTFTQLGKKPDIFFWRSHDGIEVDLIIQIGNKLYPIEIKSTSTPTLKHLEPLEKFKTLAGKDSSEEGLLICQSQKTMELPGNNLILPWQNFSAWLRDRLK